MFRRISSGWVSTRKHLKTGLEPCDFTDCISSRPASQSHGDTSHTALYLILCGHSDAILCSVSAYCGVLLHHQCHRDSKHLYIQYCQLNIIPSEKVTCILRKEPG
jgi:hypothetical protein